jgi:putative SOS response-associated peptidase YedK
MCGRFSQTFSDRDLLEYFHLARSLSLEPRYNIAPSMEVAALREEEGGRRLVFLRWGLIPFWARDRKIGYRTLNARSETAHKTASFRAAFRSRRCLIPANGFYEWDKKGGTRQPWFIHRVDGRPLALAGLWERWQDPEGERVIESCTILTVSAAEPVARLHDRMPVILEPEGFDCWLDPAGQEVETLRGMLKPAATGVLSLYPVSPYVNKAGNEGAECIEPVGKEP